MADPERQAVIEVLRKYNQQFSALIDFIGERSQVTGDDRTRAREMLRELKDDLQRECKELQRRERNRELNHLERSCLEPAIRKAEANINSRVNTTPGAKWRFDLAGAQYDISWMLDQVENRVAKK